MDLIKEKQKKNVKVLLDLIKENPDLEILPMVYSEVVFDDSYSTRVGAWGTANIDEYHHSGDRIYFKELDFEELVEKFIDDNYEEYPNLTDEELEKLAEKEVNNLEWTRAIIIYIDFL